MMLIWAKWDSLPSKECHFESERRHKSTPGGRKAKYLAQIGLVQKVKISRLPSSMSLLAVQNYTNR